MNDEVVSEPAVPATPVSPELRDELAEYGVKLPPARQMIGTEDGPNGGLEAVLGRMLLHYGLPPWAGLTGLLRHLEGSRAMHAAIQTEHIELLRQQKAELAARVTELEAALQRAAGEESE